MCDGSKHDLNTFVLFYNRQPGFSNKNLLPCRRRVSTENAIVK